MTEATMDHRTWTLYVCEACGDYGLHFETEACYPEEGEHVGPWRRVEVQPVSSGEEGRGEALLPAERLALTAARGQLKRGENPPINTTGALVVALDRLVSRPEEGRAEQEGECD